MSRVVALSCGDPAGVGPDIAAAAAQAGLTFCVIGDPRHFANAARGAGLTLSEVASVREAASVPGMAILPMEFETPATPGTPNHANAAGTIAAIEAAVAAAQSGDAAAVCTLPINKQVLVEGAGFAYPGHTEFLADLGGVDRSVMMLTAPELSVVPVTIHIALADVPGALTPNAILETIRITHAALIRDFGIPAPRVAVAGLNPHAGEGGIMGREEIEVIAPALNALRNDGIDITGPLPGDTMFHGPMRDTYDVAVTMYHDQGLIPLKAINFAEGVNVTLGLPFIRTSPDHGTAYALAGTGKADPRSLIAALRLADKMATAREAHDRRG